MGATLVNTMMDGKHSAYTRWRRVSKYETPLLCSSSQQCHYDPLMFNDDHNIFHVSGKLTSINNRGRSPRPPGSFFVFVFNVSKKW